MSAACPTCPRHQPNFAPLFFTFIVLAVVLASYHAVATHGSAAITAQNCFNGNGTVQRETFCNPTNGDTMKACVQNGHWFVSIDKYTGENRTMFPRSAAKAFWEIRDYARRSGFTKTCPEGDL